MDLPRTRKSRFDVLPTEHTYAHVSALPETAVESSADFEKERMSSLAREALEAHTHRQDQDLRVFGGTGSYELVMLEKLQQALIRNFEYIMRKDSPVVQNNPHQSQEVPQHQPSLHPVWSASKDFSSHKSSRAVAPVSVGQSNAPPHSTTEGCSVYVSGFPTDYEEEDLNAIFSPLGKLRRVKLYTSADGSRKGDALVTLARPDAVAACCIKSWYVAQLNNLHLGEGFFLKVSRADFKSREKVESATESEKNLSSEGYIPDVESFLQSVLGGAKVEELSSILLPKVCPPHYHTVCMRGVYTSTTTPSELLDIQSELLALCSRAGHVRAFSIPEKDAAISHGSIVACFEEESSARACMQMATEQGVACDLILPSGGYVLKREEEEGDVAVIHSSFASEGNPEGDLIEGVDDFLNSLL